MNGTFWQHCLVWIGGSIGLAILILWVQILKLKKLLQQQDHDLQHKQERLEQTEQIHQRMLSYFLHRLLSLTSSSHTSEDQADL